MARDIIRSLPVTRCKIGLIVEGVVTDEKTVNLLNHITLESAQRRIRKLDGLENHIVLKTFKTHQNYKMRQRDFFNHAEEYPNNRKEGTEND